MNAHRWIPAALVVALGLCLTSCLSDPPTVESQPAAILAFDDLEAEGNFGFGSKLFEAEQAVFSIAKYSPPAGQDEVDFGALEATQRAGGAGKELKLIRSCLLVEMSGREAILTLRFALEPGRTANLGINGRLERFDEPGPFPEFEGVTTFVSYDKESRQGMLYVAGPLKTVRFGGVRVWIDNILYAVLP